MSRIVLFDFRIRTTPDLMSLCMIFNWMNFNPGLEDWGRKAPMFSLFQFWFDLHPYAWKYKLRFLMDYRGFNISKMQIQRPHLFNYRGPTLVQIEGLFWRALESNKGGKKWGFFGIFDCKAWALCSKDDGSTREGQKEQTNNMLGLGKHTREIDNCYFVS